MLGQGQSAGTLLPSASKVTQLIEVRSISRTPRVTLEVILVNIHNAVGLTGLHPDPVRVIMRSASLALSISTTSVPADLA
jgi:hypothetical protein